MVDRTALEMRHRCKPIGGSNPSLSAKKHAKRRKFKTDSKLDGAGTTFTNFEKLILTNRADTLKIKSLSNLWGS